MPTLLSDQRIHHPFHPYQIGSHCSGNHVAYRRSCLPRTPKLACSSESLSRRQEHTQPTCERDTRLSPKRDSVTLSGSIKIYDLGKMSNSTSLSSGLFHLQTSSPEACLDAPHPFAGLSPTISQNTHSSISNNPGSSDPAQDLERPDQNLTKSILISPCSSFVSRRPSTSAASTPRIPRDCATSTQDFVSYLKAWRPPVEYYARRRTKQSSLWYPSRRPSLPALLEEHVTHDGQMTVVRAEVAMSTSVRAYQRKIFPRQYFTSSISPSATHQGWDDESDEELATDDSDEDDTLESDSDSDEAVTPTNSLAPPTTYFLQPLFLTKPPGC